MPWWHGSRGSRQRPAGTAVGQSSEAARQAMQCDNVSRGPGHVVLAQYQWGKKRFQFLRDVRFHSLIACSFICTVQSNTNRESCNAMFHVHNVLSGMQRAWPDSLQLRTVGHAPYNIIRLSRQLTHPRSHTYIQTLLRSALLRSQCFK